MNAPVASVVALVLSAIPLGGSAQEAAPPAAPAPEGTAEAERRRLEEEIARDLARELPAEPPRAPGAAPAGAPPAAAATGPNPLARLLLMPDLSAIARAGAVLNTLDARSLSPRPGPTSPEDRPELFLDEVELALQAVVDPYARADLFVAFGPEGAEVEEAFLTATALPYGFQLRAGQLFAPFGRLNGQHPHAWEFVDAPLALGRILAEERLAGPGVDVSWLAPLPWFAELQLAAQSTSALPAEVLPGEDAGPEPRLTGIARLLQYLSLSETTTLGVGLSAGMRDEPLAGAYRDLGGVDVYLRHRVPASRAVATFQAEWYGRRLRGVPGGEDTEHGGWAQAFFRRTPRFGYGVRYEQAPAAAVEDAGAGDEPERRYGAVFGWFPSEFQRVRLQASYDRLPGGRDGLEAILHLEFGIGAHGAHTF